eukprot:Blabericola_migrator_1__5322@NODE_272_length_10504_cov_138_380473_g227_i0_p5_GENE_NODE_272_length_10504_cov_138_380473_g227_i0NODE_272_length_10504_cov_138_380473_g227_i0_p5_ORF_typecomplete_len224_score13_56CECR6_TMEM121/PF14997_6/0_15CECR6_TMEM121/PF14997_6/1_4e02DUF4818/PF16089_5/4_6DUF4818/PF16089_5/9_5e03DUF4818/PF16089_5/21GWT1/PF06423_12/56GWT1/PF06423_12/6_1Tmemb_14/PF03647_13/14Tmemb_14/PF03647_13/75_NODE_272_length_10504_cov_138_380473_g227_i070427713
MDTLEYIPWTFLFASRRRPCDRARSFAFIICGLMISFCLLFSAIEATRQISYGCSQVLAVSAVCLGLPLDLLDVIETSVAHERILFFTGLLIWIILHPQSLVAAGASCTGLTIAGAGFHFPHPTRHEVELAMAVIMLSAMSAFIIQTCFVTIVSSNGVLQDSNPYVQYVTMTLLSTCLAAVVLSLTVGVEIQSATEALYTKHNSRFGALKSCILSPRRIPPCA